MDENGRDLRISANAQQQGKHITTLVGGSVQPASPGTPDFREFSIFLGKVQIGFLSKRPYKRFWTFPMSSQKESKKLRRSFRSNRASFGGAAAKFAISEGKLITTLGTG